jgi:micrococcal nuclease
MDRRAWLCIVVLVVASGCAGLPAGDPTPAGGADVPPEFADAEIRAAYVVTVVDVVDGDTVDVRYRNGTEETVRLLGVDAPEVRSETSPGEFEGVPDSESGRTWLREWGGRGGAFAERTVGGEEVRILVDARSDVRGSYGRLLAYVYHDGDHLNRMLLEEGYARLYDAPFSKRASCADPELAAAHREKLDDVRVRVDHPEGDHPAVASADHGDAAHLLSFDEDLGSAQAGAALRAHVDTSVKHPDAFARLFAPERLWPEVGDGAYPGPDWDPRE